MRSIWFKQRYVESILQRKKMDTLRARRVADRLEVGETIALQVGPRKPFATAVVTAIEAIDTLPPERREGILDCYGSEPKELVLISFEIQ